MNANGRYHKYVRMTNMQASPKLTEDLVHWIHELDVGNIFDLAVFRQPLRNMATANVTLWNRARHEELIEAIDRKPYKDTTIRCRGSHRVNFVDRPIRTDTRVPVHADAHHDAHTYTEPQTGPFDTTLAEWIRRRAVPRQRATIETKTVITRQTFVEPLNVTVTNDRRAPVHRRLGVSRFDPMRGQRHNAPTTIVPTNDPVRQIDLPQADVTQADIQQPDLEEETWD
jgi:hypothetical protein